MEALDGTGPSGLGQGFGPVCSLHQMQPQLPQTPHHIHTLSSYPQHTQLHEPVGGWSLQLSKLRAELRGSSDTRLMVPLSWQIQLGGPHPFALHLPFFLPLLPVLPHLACPPTSGCPPAANLRSWWRPRASHTGPGNGCGDHAGSGQAPGPAIRISPTSGLSPPSFITPPPNICI